MLSYLSYLRYMLSKLNIDIANRRLLAADYADYCNSELYQLQHENDLLKDSDAFGKVALAERSQILTDHLDSFYFQCFGVFFSEERIADPDMELLFECSASKQFEELCRQVSVFIGKQLAFTDALRNSLWKI